MNNKFLNGYTKRRCTNYKLLLTSSDISVVICVLLCSFSTNIFTKNYLSFLISFSEHTGWVRCRKPFKTFLVILGSINKFGLICIFVIASFRCTLNSYFLLVVLLVMLISRKCSECL